MTQPLDRTCELPALGDLDSETGEFWATQTFNMPRDRQNLSAFERNRLYLNLGDFEFFDSSFAAGCEIDADSRSAIAADFDRDGRTDLLVGSAGGGPLRLFLNRIPNAGQSVRLHLLAGVGNRPAIGTRVVATIGRQQIVRDLFPVNGNAGQAPAEMIIGTGQAASIDSLTVRWPNGNIQVFLDVPATGTVTLHEAQGIVENH